MTHPAYLSTSCLGCETVARWRRDGAVPDGARVELGAGLSRGDALWLLDRARERGRGFLLHNYFPPQDDGLVINLASGDEGIRERSVAFCLRAMDLCRQVGAPFYSVHAGFAVDPDPDALGRPLPTDGALPLDDALRLFRDSVAVLAGRAAQTGVGLLLENHVLAPCNAPDGANGLLLFCGLEDFELFDTCFPWPEVGVLLDVGHIKVTARTLGFDPRRAVDAVRHRIRAVHLHDNDGTADQHRPFDDGAWFLPELPRLPEGVVHILENVPCGDTCIAAMQDLLSREV